MKNAPLIALLVVVIAGISFYGGMTYQKQQTPVAGNFANLSPEDRQQRMQALGGGAGGFAGRGGNGGQAGGQIRMGGFVNGEVMAKDEKSMTMKLRDGGSQIVFFSASTTIGKMTDGSLQDLVTGTQVMVAGNTNTDGSMTAQSIQLRPEMMRASSAPATSTGEGL